MTHAEHRTLIVLALWCLVAFVLGILAQRWASVSDRGRIVVHVINAVVAGGVLALLVRAIHRW